MITKAYAEWGERCVERFLGMFAFAFALVERDSGRVVLARDRLGIKPLYLAETAEGLRFASTSIGFDAGGGREGDEFTFSDLIAREFGTDHHRWRLDASRIVDALGGAIAAMSEPMVSHDAVAFYLLSEEVSRSRKVVQSGQGADEVFGGYSWYPAMAGADGRETDEYARVFFDRGHDDVADLLADEHLVGEDVSRAFVLEGRAPSLDHEVVELAAACPPELKLAHGGKGGLMDAARRLPPGDVVDRPKGYLPVPALSPLEGPVLDLVGDALNLDGSELWQLGLLELWLQEQVL